MKKMVSILLAGLMLISLAACGSGGQRGDADYIIATDTTFAPFEFTDDNNEFVGIDVDLMNEIAKDQGFTVEWRPLGFDAAMAAVETGQAHGCIAGASITDKRKETYDFSEPYYDSYVSIAVKADSPITGLDELKGQKIAVKTGTTGAECAETLKEKYGFTLTYFESSDQMYEDVEKGNQIACFEDQPVMAYSCKKDKAMKIIAELEEDFATPYGFVVLKGQNKELLEKFNAGLANIKSNGKYDEIVAKYTSVD